MLAALGASTACGMLGSSQTTLRAPDAAPAQDFAADSGRDGADFLRVRGVHVCTQGDDPVRLTGVELQDAPDAEVTGFRVSREPQDDVGEGDEGSTQLTTVQQATQIEPSQWFTQSCDAGPGRGSSSITVDVKITALPIDSTGLRLTYEVQGAEGTQHETVLPTPITVCNDVVGCTDPEGDEEADG